MNDPLPPEPRHEFSGGSPTPQAGAVVKLPDFALVVLIGASGSGKSTFARKHFLPTEILSSDASRGLISDDENDQSATSDAFEVLHFIALPFAEPARTRLRSSHPVLSFPRAT